MKAPRFRQAIPQDEYRPFPRQLIADFVLGFLTLMGFIFFLLLLWTH